MKRMIKRNSEMPLYLQVKNDIIDRINSGRIKIGDKLMSENEMIEYYGVGRVTIRAALNELTTNGCLKKEHGRGTFCIAVPNCTKRMNIDVILNCNDTYLIPFLLSGINSVLEKENCNMLLHDSKNSPQTISRIMNSIYVRGTDGIIMQSAQSSQNFFPEQLTELCKQFSVPIVSVCGSIPGVCANLMIDDSYGSKIAAQYVLDCGHTRILGLYPKDDFGADVRINSVMKTVGKQENAEISILLSKEISEDAAKLLQIVREKKITAIICYNDFFAVQCMHVLQENGFSIPEDISLIGFDDSSLSTSCLPQLTTISHPKDHMGSDAARSILLRINNKLSGYSKTTYRPELVIRQSVLDISEK